MLIEIIHRTLHFLSFSLYFPIASVEFSKHQGGYCGIFVARSSLFVGYIVWLDLFHTSECCVPTMFSCCIWQANLFLTDKSMKSVKMVESFIEIAQLSEQKKTFLQLFF